MVLGARAVSLAAGFTLLASGSAVSASTLDNLLNRFLGHGKVLDRLQHVLYPIVPAVNPATDAERIDDGDWILLEEVENDISTRPEVQRSHGRNEALGDLEPRGAKDVFIGRKAVRPEEAMETEAKAGRAESGRSEAQPPHMDKWATLDPFEADMDWGRVPLMTTGERSEMDRAMTAAGRFILDESDWLSHDASREGLIRVESAARLRVWLRDYMRMVSTVEARLFSITMVQGEPWLGETEARLAERLERWKAKARSRGACLDDVFQEVGIDDAAQYLLELGRVYVEYPEELSLWSQRLHGLFMLLNHLPTLESLGEREQFVTSILSITPKPTGDRDSSYKTWMMEETADFEAVGDHALVGKPEGNTEELIPIRAVEDLVLVHAIGFVSHMEWRYSEETYIKSEQAVGARNRHDRPRGAEGEILVVTVGEGEDWFREPYRNRRRYLLEHGMPPFTGDSRFITAAEDFELMQAMRYMRSLMSIIRTRHSRHGSLDSYSLQSSAVKHVAKDGFATALEYCWRIMARVKARHDVAVAQDWESVLNSVGRDESPDSVPSYFWHFLIFGDVQSSAERSSVLEMGGAFPQVGEFVPRIDLPHVLLFRSREFVEMMEYVAEISHLDSMLDSREDPDVREPPQETSKSDFELSVKTEVYHKSAISMERLESYKSEDTREWRFHSLKLYMQQLQEGIQEYQDRGEMMMARRAMMTRTWSVVDTRKAVAEVRALILDDVQWARARAQAQGAKSDGDVDGFQAENGGDVPGKTADGDWKRRSGRRLSTSSSSPSSSDVADTSGNYQVNVVVSTGATSTDWNGANYTLEAGTPVPGQTRARGEVIGRGTIAENGVSPSTSTYNLERGCYNIYTNAGTRPYDVIWQVEVDGAVHQEAKGGGLDFHTFGIGGAMCDMSNCFRQCYIDREDTSSDECSSFGDLLAPSSEPAGANCTCTEEEELELRLTCLAREACDRRSQCYLVDEAAEAITTANTLRLKAYVAIQGTTIDTTAFEAAMAQWLDLSPEYVELILVNGITPAATSTSRSRKLEEESLEGFLKEGDENARRKWAKRMRNRNLQTTTRFKRLEFLIIGATNTDFVDASFTIGEGVRGLNTVFAAQEEGSGVETAEAYTAEYVISEERVPAADTPGTAIAGSGDGTGVDAEGEIIVEATQAPEDSEDFYRSAQFLVGAGLVVVVSFVLSIIACIVCAMKRKERKDFKKKNEPVDGRPKPIQHVDPWGSITRTFQENNGGASHIGSEVVAKNGSHTANGSSSTA